MNITQVPSYKTTDGRLHESKLKALSEQQKIDIRAVVQSDERVGKQASMTHSDAVAVYITHQEKLNKVFRQYQIAINRERSRANKIEIP